MAKCRHKSFNATGVHVAVLLAALLCSLQRPATAADLLRFYRDARQQDPVYAGARDAWAATQEKLPQARAQLFPSATLTATPSYTDREIIFRNGPLVAGQFNSNAVTVSVTQPLFRMQNVAQYRSAQTQLAQSDMTLAAAAQDLILRVAQAYFDTLLAQDNLNLAGAQKSAIAEQLGIARRNYQLGAVAITDVREAQARFDLVVSQEISAQNDLDNRKEVLQQITGKPPAALAPLGPRFALQGIESSDINSWVDQAGANSQQIAIQKAAIELAEQELARARYGHYPTLDLVANYSKTGLGQGAQGTLGSDTRAAVIGLQLSIPLYAGGTVNSQVRQAQFNLDKARQDLDAATRQVGVAVKQAFRGVASGISQVAALETALRSSQSSFDSSKLGKEVGIRTQADVLDAQQQLFTARFNLAQARYNSVLNWIKLRAGAGLLDEATVGQVNEWLSAPDFGPNAGAPTFPELAASSKPAPAEAIPLPLVITPAPPIAVAVPSVEATPPVAAEVPNVAAPHVAPVVAEAATQRGVFLQFGAFGSQQNAENHLAWLRMQVDEVAPALHLFPKDGLFRVHAGPYANPADARAAAKRIGETQGIKAIVITR
jgi:outer membrane protein